MGLFGLKMRVTGDVWMDVHDLESLKSLPHQDIHIQVADLRDAMSINAVASALKVSVREVRRWIETGDFPPSNLRRGRMHLWTRQAVRSWRKHKLEQAKRGRSKVAGRWAEVDQIESEEEHDRLLHHGDTQKLTREVREMNALLAADPAAFERKYPKLKDWLPRVKSRSSIVR